MLLIARLFELAMTNLLSSLAGTSKICLQGLSARVLSADDISIVSPHVNINIEYLY